MRVVAVNAGNVYSSALESSEADDGVRRRFSPSILIRVLSWNYIY